MKLSKHKKLQKTILRGAFNAFVFFELQLMIIIKQFCMIVVVFIWWNCFGCAQVWRYVKIVYFCAPMYGYADGKIHCFFSLANDFHYFYYYVCLFVFFSFLLIMFLYYVEQYNFHCHVIIVPIRLLLNSLLFNSNELIVHNSIKFKLLFVQQIDV